MVEENNQSIARDAIIEMIPGIGSRFAFLGKVVRLGTKVEIARPPLPSFTVDLEDLLRQSNIGGLKFKIIDPAGELFSLDEISKFNNAVMEDQRKWEMSGAPRLQNGL